MIKAQAISGKKAAKITEDKYGIELYVMRNGWQWSGTCVDEELLTLIGDVIDKYKSQNNGGVSDVL